jgi:uncharacterized tellurite resistance protein B-like protein
MLPFSLTPEQAVSHLFFHCCFRDGHVAQDEIKAVSGKLVAIGLNADLNFTDEVRRYQTYRPIKDEAVYLDELIACIRPANGLALYSYCLELCLSDGLLKSEEETLLQNLGRTLDLDETEQAVCKKLMVQRKVVDTEKVF